MMLVQNLFPSFLTSNIDNKMANINPNVLANNKHYDSEPMNLSHHMNKSPTNNNNNNSNNYSAISGQTAPSSTIFSHAAQVNPLISNNSTVSSANAAESKQNIRIEIPCNDPTVNLKLPRNLANIFSSQNVDYFPALKGKYELVRNIQQSLFGTVKLGLNKEFDKQVCIKISCKEYSNSGHSVCGPLVMENVRAEADILRFLTQQANSLSSGSSSTTPYQSQRGISSTRLSPYPCSPLQRSGRNSVNLGFSVVDYDAEVRCGAEYIAKFVDELEDDVFHYLITEYCASDMFSVLSDIEKEQQGLSKDDEKPGYVSEDQGRSYFRELVQAVAFLHSHHVIHLDLSIENICVNAQKKIKLIDFGLAVMHPHSPNQASLHYSKQDSQNLPHVQYHDEQESAINSKNCTSSMATPRAKRQSSEMMVTSPIFNNSSSSQQRTSFSFTSLENLNRAMNSVEQFFPCKPVLSSEQQTAQREKKLQNEMNKIASSTGMIAKPGKISTMSPELYNCNTVWDGYSNDCYALGVILYLLLTGRPAYSRPCASDTCRPNNTIIIIKIFSLVCSTY
jgi:serine/threonine protein kinase